MKFHAMAPLAYLMMSVGCGPTIDIGAGEEVINGLRILGVTSTPVVPQLVKAGAQASSVTLSIYAAVPEGSEVTFAAGITSGRVTIAPADMVVSATQYEDHRGFRLAKIDVKVPTPTESAFDGGSNNSATGTSPGSSNNTSGSTSNNGSSAGVSSPQNAESGGTTDPATIATGNGAGGASQTGGNVNYAFTLSVGDRSITASGNFLTRSEGHADLQATAPTCDIASPTAQDTVNRNGTDLSLSYSVAQDSDLPILSWFVSGGSIADRNADATRWTPGYAGGFTAIATVRTTRTFGFCLKAIDVEAK